jgi:hypothetical protein
MIRICVPYYDNYDNLKPLIAELEGDERFEFRFCKGPYIGINRDTCVVKGPNDLKKPVIVEADFIFIDSDMRVTKADIERLLEIGKSFPVVALPYKTHVNNEVYQCGTWAHVPGIIKDRVSINSSGLHKMDWTGAGLLYVENVVMRTIDFPFFRSYVHEEGLKSVQVGEDIGFCVQLHKYNIPIIVDFDNPVGHDLRENARTFKEQEV